MSRFATDYYIASFEAHPPVVRGLALHPLSVAEFTEACEMLLMQAQANQCRYWLLDGQADANIRPPDVYDWLLEEFLPRAYKVLGRVPCLAFVAQPDFQRTIRATSRLLPVPTQPAAMQINWFTNEADGLEWLNKLRAIAAPEGQ
jgi:hypothetical protein